MKTIALLSLLLLSIDAFQVLPINGHQRVAMASSLKSEPKADQEVDKAVECYITNAKDLYLGDGEKPEVVCTSEPEEYAWFNGLDPKELVPTEGMDSGSLECVEGASPKGTPEWECK